MNQSKSQDILAKLLSNENITVTRGKVKTAAFDIKNRVLVLPRWKDMTENIEEMLMLHEVGHALYTSPEGYGIVFEEKKHLKDYANVIEDVRIEKRMKERYPGSRKSFNAGYKELNAKDFFSVSSKDLDKLLLIDRINLYYKVGHNCGVKFTLREQEIIAKVDQCKTEADVIKLAEEIYEFSENELKEQMANQSGQDQSDEIDPDDIDWDNIEFTETDDGDSVKQPKKFSKPLSTEQEEKLKQALESTTTNVFDKKLESLADDTIEHVYYDLKFEYETPGVIIPYKTVYKELKQLIAEDVLVERRHKFNKFKADSAPMINYLIKEFEMRKSATAYKRTKISRLGQLDPRKLYAYKIKEDLFKQISTVQDGKKHGMIFLLDWSGSMSNCIEETIEQVVNLAMFCQRIQIPYQVFAFTDGYKSDDRHNEIHRQYSSQTNKDNPNGIDSQSHFNLLELFSSQMTGVEFNKQLELMLARPYVRRNYKLNGTPLNHALLYMVDYVGKFKHDYQVEKLSFITLTDGESNSLNSSRGIRNGLTHGYINGEYRRSNIRSFAHDSITKKDYELSSEQGEQTAMLLNVIRDRYDVTSIGFFIMDPRGNGAGSFIKHNMGPLKPGANYGIRERIIQGIRKDKFVIMKDVPGRDEYYIIRSDQHIEEFDMTKINPDASAATIARQLTNGLNSRKNSRIVLNSFIEQVA